APLFFLSAPLSPPAPRSEDSVGVLAAPRIVFLAAPPARAGPRSEDSVGGLPQARPGSVPSAAVHPTGDRGRGGVIADGSGGRGTCTARPPRDSRAQRCSRAGIPLPGPRGNRGYRSPALTGVQRPATRRSSR